jgi:hypothetical protein
MSIATRPKRLIETFVPSSASESFPSTPPTLIRHSLVAEAPEQKTREGEAPESTRGRAVEAPDAGEKRDSPVEREFTHGRSQS